jgi:hypothetical protein
MNAIYFTDPDCAGPRPAPVMLGPRATFRLRHPQAWQDMRAHVAALAAQAKACRDAGHPLHLAGPSELCLNEALASTTPRTTTCAERSPAGDSDGRGRDLSTRPLPVAP